MYLSAPFAFAFLQRYPNLRQKCSVVGLVVIALALIISSFSTRVWHLILSQGVLYALGGSMLYTPAIIFLDEWFILRKGFAFGVMVRCSAELLILSSFLESQDLLRKGAPRSTSETYLAVQEDLEEAKLTSNSGQVQESREFAFLLS